LLFVLRTVLLITGVFVLLTDRNEVFELKILDVKLLVAVCVFDTGADLVTVRLKILLLDCLFE